MSAMDHPAAHDRIEDLVLEPARLRELDTSPLPEDLALREHLAGCAACASDLDAWRRLHAAVADALPRDTDSAAAAAAVELIVPPSTLRADVLAAVGGPKRGVPAASISIRRARQARRVAPWVGLAAGFIVLVGAGVITADQVARRTAADEQAQELAAALAIVDRMLATDHKVVELRRPTGITAGTISWSRHDWVVLTRALDPAPAGREYLCWLETDGRTVLVGHMDFAAGTAYWVATLDEWQTWEIGESTQFVVTLEDAGATAPSGPPLLIADLGA